MQVILLTALDPGISTFGTSFEIRSPGSTLSPSLLEFLNFWYLPSQFLYFRPGVPHMLIQSGHICLRSELLNNSSSLYRHYLSMPADMPGMFIQCCPHVLPMFVDGLKGLVQSVTGIPWSTFGRKWEPGWSWRRPLIVLTFLFLRPCGCHFQVIAPLYADTLRLARVNHEFKLSGIFG